MKYAALIALAIAGVTAGLLLAGLRESEPEFSAESFVEAANEHDAGLTLGESLTHAESSGTLRAISFSDHEEDRGRREPATHQHDAGTLAIFGSREEATSEYERCELATLVCFRVENVALMFTATTDGADLSQLAAAIDSMGAD